jgi:hypothetical protein
LLPVVGQPGGVNGLAREVEAVEGDGGAAVPHGALLGGEARVEGLAQLVVSEAQAELLGGFEELALFELAEPAEGVGVGDFAQEVDVHLAAQDGGGAAELEGLGGALVEALEEEFLDGERGGEAGELRAQVLAVADEAPSARVVALEEALLDDVVEELGDIEGVAVGASGDEIDEGGFGLLDAEHLVEEGAQVVGVEPFELDGGKEVLDLLEGGAGGEGLGAVEAEDEPGLALLADEAAQLGEGAERELVGPLEVVEDEGGGVLLGVGAEGLDEGVEDALSRGGGG